MLMYASYLPSVKTHARMVDCNIIWVTKIMQESLISKSALTEHKKQLCQIIFNYY